MSHVPIAFSLSTIVPLRKISRSRHDQLKYYSLKKHETVKY